MDPGADEGPVSLPGDSEDQVLVRVKFTAKDLGTDPPPSRCHLRAYPTARGWVLLLWSSPAPTQALRAWAKAQTHGTEIAFGKIGDRTVGFECAALPETWETLFGLFDADHLIMEADGTTLTHLEGPRSEVGQFLSGMDLRLATESVQELAEADERIRSDLLTQAQEHALGRAAALGYFSVPREIHLRELADRLDTSESALSELLRRAQARLVFAYLDNKLGGIEALLDLQETPS